MRRTSRNGARAVALIVVLAIAIAAYAKGAFQAEGTISDLQTRPDEITLRFTGKISLGYATTAASDSTQWKDLDINTLGVTLTIHDWTSRHRPDQKADPAETDREISRIYTELAEYAKSSRPLRISIDNPQLTFSNDGQLVRVSGTFIYSAPPYQ
jgi:hypothetical protein